MELPIKKKCVLADANHFYIFSFDLSFLCGKMLLREMNYFSPKILRTHIPSESLKFPLVLRDRIAESSLFWAEMLLLSTHKKNGF